MLVRNTPDRFGLVSKVLHWALAFLILAWYGWLGAGGYELLRSLWERLQPRLCLDRPAIGWLSTLIVIRSADNPAA